MPANRHRRYCAVLLACLPLVAEQAQAQTPGQGTGFRGALEAGYERSPARAATLFNPGGTLLDAGIDTGVAALNLRGQYAVSDLRFAASVWGIYRNNPDGVRQHDRAVIQEAFADYQLTPDMSLAAGKQILRWGSGYVWNPSNPLNDPDANNTSRARSYQREGDYTIKYDWTLRSGSASFYATRAIQNDPLLSLRRTRENYVIAKYQHMLDGADITGIVGGNGKEHFAGFSASAVIGNQLELHAEGGLRNRRRAPRVDVINIPTGPGTNAQAAVWNVAPARDTTTTFLAGGQYTFENKANVIVEYFYNGNGYNGREYNRVLAAARSNAAVDANSPLRAAATGFLLDGNRLAGRLRQHYLFGRWAHDEVLPKTDASVYLRYGLSDQSTVHGLLLSYALSQRAKLRFGAEFYHGDANSEARLIPVKARYEATVTIEF